MPSKFLENIVILCFERRFCKENRVIRLVSNSLPPPKIFGLSNVVCYERGLLWTVLLWTWSVMNWSVMNVVCFQMWSVMNVVCNECGLLWTGLLWTGLLWTWSVMKAVCYERVCYERVCYEQVCNERGLFWVVCCEWSVMNRSVLKGNRFK